MNMRLSFRKILIRSEKTQNKLSKIPKNGRKNLQSPNRLINIKFLQLGSWITWMIITLMRKKKMKVWRRFNLKWEQMFTQQHSCSWLNQTSPIYTLSLQLSVSWHSLVKCFWSISYLIARKELEVYLMMFHSHPQMLTVLDLSALAFSTSNWFLKFKRQSKWWALPRTIQTVSKAIPWDGHLSLVLWSS